MRCSTCGRHHQMLVGGQCVGCFVDDQDGVEVDRRYVTPERQAA